MLPRPAILDDKNIRETREGAQKIEALEERVNKLSTLCNALLITFQKHTGFTEEEFLSIIKTTEKKQKEVMGCTQCGEILQRGIERCIYCGAAHAYALGKFV